MRSILSQWGASLVWFVTFINIAADNRYVAAFCGFSAVLCTFDFLRDLVKDAGK